MPSETPVREQDKFMLRLPDGMRDRIAAAAKANGRSMNSEIVARLAYSFPADTGDEIEEIRTFTKETKNQRARELAQAVLNLIEEAQRPPDYIEGTPIGVKKSF